MVDEETPSDFGAGVDFNTSQEAADMGGKPSQKPQFISPEKMC